MNRYWKATKRYGWLTLKWAIAISKPIIRESAKMALEKKITERINKL